MKLVNETQRIAVATVHGKTVEGVVRVRGINVRSGRLHEPAATWLAVHDLIRREPVAVIVRDAGGERTIAVPQPRPRDLRWLMAGVPVMAWLATRLFRRGVRGGPFE